MTILNAFLDKTIIFSFDKSGFIRHKKYFQEDLMQKNITGKVALVTGGTSGIGEEAAHTLSQLGAKVFVTGRNESKGKLFEENNSHSKFVSLDMAKWSELNKFCEQCENLDYIVLNAGSMPDQIVLNEFGVESQCASQLLGHYFLILKLKELGKLNPQARIVWVSSGGMYLKSLDLDALFRNVNYDKVATYANVKRAQVTLVEELAHEKEWDEYKIFCMHPGWVGTAGLLDALPVFSKLMKNKLRNTYQGADTILWLLLTNENADTIESGGFYFDRKKVSPYLSTRYIPSMEIRKSLLTEINKYRLKF